MSEWTYKIILHGELIDETPLRGIGWLKFESAKLLGRAELHEVYVGNKYDPVIHKTIVHRGGILPPCPDAREKCPYLKTVEHDFYSTPRTTAFRTEVMCPSDRCGFMLKPSKIGGSFYDYDFCICSKNSRGGMPQARKDRKGES